MKFVHQNENPHPRPNPPVPDQTSLLNNRGGDSCRENLPFPPTLLDCRTTVRGGFGDRRLVGCRSRDRERGADGEHTSCSWNGEGGGLLHRSAQRTCCAGKGGVLCGRYTAHAVCHSGEGGSVGKGKGGGRSGGGSPRLGDGLEGQGGIQERGGGCQ